MMIAAVTFVVGSLLLKETRGVLIREEVETGRPGELLSDIEGPT